MTPALNFSLYAACSVIVVPRFNADELIKTIRKKRPTLFPGVPAIYIAIMAHPKVDSFDLTSIKFCVTGASAMPVDILRRFEQKTGSRIIEGYGLWKQVRSRTLTRSKGRENPARSDWRSPIPIAAWSIRKPGRSMWRWAR